MKYEKTIYVIVASQEYSSANHKNLWKKLAAYHPTVVVNIAADYIVSNLRNKQYRIKEAKKDPLRELQSLLVVRPFFFLRPELLPAMFKGYISRRFWVAVEKCIPDYRDCRINLIVYDAIWTRIVNYTDKNVKVGYYLFDEVRYNGDDCSIDKKRYANDEYACQHSDVIFTMTKALAESRKDYNNHIVVLGNGSVYSPAIEQTIYLERSVAFVGNFRNWVDNDLLEGLISKRRDITFAFAGSVEEDMCQFFDYLLNTYDNTLYMGKYTKERMAQLYRNFNAIIIPYRHNKFIQATRPIKIVESVMAGIPVITVPVNGYEECSFIRFADDVEDFSKQIDYILANPIDINSEHFKDFITLNTWEAKAKIIENEMAK